MLCLRENLVLLMGIQGFVCLGIYIYKEYVLLGGDPGEDPGHAGEITSPGWPGNASGSLRMSWKVLRARGKSGSTCWVCCPRNPTPEKADENGWI